jgi:hypothetical protein
MGTASVVDAIACEPPPALQAAQLAEEVGTIAQPRARPELIRGSSDKYRSERSKSLGR